MLLVFYSTPSAMLRNDRTDGTSGDMEIRVAALETAMKTVQGDLHSIKIDMGALRTDFAKEQGLFRADLAKDQGQLRTDFAKEMGLLRADFIKELGSVRSEVAELRGKLDSKPGLWQVITMIVVIGTMLVAAQLAAARQIFQPTADSRPWAGQPSK